MGFYLIIQYDTQYSPRSTHNTRIERMWVEVGSQFVRQWKAFFCRLEAYHGLDRTSGAYLWILHQLFLEILNDDCQAFIQEWNAHPISGKRHDQSPLVSLHIIYNFPY